MTFFQPDWKPISEYPESGQRPGRQWVFLEGSKNHSGVTWVRQYIGDVILDGTGAYGYRETDLRRLLDDGDMDFGEVKFWAAYKIYQPDRT